MITQVKLPGQIRNVEANNMLITSMDKSIAPEKQVTDLDWEVVPSSS